MVRCDAENSQIEKAIMIEVASGDTCQSGFSGVRLKCSACREGAVADTQEDINGEGAAIGGRDVELAIPVEVSDRDVLIAASGTVVHAGMQAAIRAGKEYRDADIGIATVAHHEIRNAVAVEIPGSDFESGRVPGGVVIEAGAESSVAEALQVGVAEFRVTDDDVLQAIPIEVAHQCRDLGVTANSVADGWDRDGSVAVAEKNGDVGAVVVGDDDVGFAVAVDVSDGGGFGINVSVRAAGSYCRAIIDAGLEGAVAIVDVDGDVLVVAIGTNDFRFTVAREVARRHIAGVVDGVGSDQAGALLREGKAAGGLKIDVNPLGGEVQASEVNFAVAIEIGERQAIGRVARKRCRSAVLECAIAVAQQNPDTAGAGGGIDGENVQFSVAVEVGENATLETAGGDGEGCTLRGVGEVSIAVGVGNPYINAGRGAGVNLDDVGFAVAVEVADQDGVAVGEQGADGCLKGAVAVAQCDGNAITIEGGEVTDHGYDVHLAVAVHVRLVGFLSWCAASGDLRSADETDGGDRGDVS